MTAYAPAVFYGGAHIKALETCKNKALKRNKGNFERQTRISFEGWIDIQWWMEKVGYAPNPIRLDNPAVIITTDASLQGWGAHIGDLATGGRWLPEEADAHINVLELRAVLLGLQSLVRNENTHIQIFTDNTTTLAYIRKMGGTKSVPCNQMAQQIWGWAEERRNWLTVAFIPGCLNILADSYSREFKDHLEWSLAPDIFKRICKFWGEPQIDLFASRNNFKIAKYVSWRPEPKSWKVDAFTFEWKDFFYYVFPPFNLIARVARKLRIEGSSAILVAPHWPSQPWFAALNRWSRDQRYLPRARDNLLPQGPLLQRGDVSTTPLAVFLF